MRLAPFVLLFLLACFTTVRAAEPANDDAWLQQIRPAHPRMFFNTDTWPAVKDYALKHEAAYYARIKKKVADMPAQPDTAACEKGSQVLYGPSALMAAFVWRMEQDKDALDKARRYIQGGVKFYTHQSAAGLPVNWYSSDRVQCLAAYDWIYDQLTVDERTAIARGFFQHMHDDETVKRVGEHNLGDYKTGFYGSPNLPWYVGLAFYKDGVDDNTAESLLKRGYADHIKLLEYRRQASGDDGGIGSLAVGYGLGFYPWAEFNFMHTFQSATGKNLADRFDHLSLLPNWVFWNCLPGNMTWGLADSAPAGKFGSAFLELHMLQIAHFYAARFPDRARFAMWVRDHLIQNREHDDYWWPVAPLLLPGCATLPEPAGPNAGWPLARNFEQMGLVTMRSDWTDNAVCAAFVAGGNVNQHRHYDQGHFILYRSGHLAIDSGDYGPRERNDHLSEYLYRTVAHNAVLIMAPPEADTPPLVWGGKAGTLDGGQSAFDGKQLAFETSPEFTYAAADATACYDARKCKLATRQFVFLRPDVFVICDRVTSTRPEYAKRWLLHTVAEPIVAADGRTFRAVYGPSALLCRTLYPEDAVLEKIGGPGKEFWSAGKNHPQEGKFEKIRELDGSWRVEVSPKSPAEEDVFLHVIRVGNQSMTDMGPVDLVRADGALGARIKTAAGATTVLFDVKGPTGGHITLEGSKKIDRPLTVKIQPQSGLGVDEKISPN